MLQACCVCCLCLCVCCLCLWSLCVLLVCGGCVLVVGCSGASCGLVLGSAGVICWGLVFEGVDRDLHLKGHAMTLAYTHGFCDYLCSLTAIPCRMHRISSDLRS